MPRIILKCRYLKHEKAHLAHLVRYIATREGVEMARDTHDHLPATARQKQLIDELLRALPDTQESYEYRDYQANPKNKRCFRRILPWVTHRRSLLFPLSRIWTW